MRYITWGPVRGFGGVMHRKVDAAHKAARRDDGACKKVGGYSDRRVYAVNVDAGETWESVEQAYRFDPWSVRAL